MAVFTLSFLACATCVFDGNDPSSTAASMAILFMLGILVVVLGGFLKFIHYLSSCEKRGAPPEAELLSTINSGAPKS